jgi:plastocyanin
MAIDATVGRARAATAEDQTRRSLAMWALPVFAAVQIVIMLDVLRQAFIPPLVVFSALTMVSLIAVLVRPGRWTYLAGGIVLILVTAGNAPIIIDGIIHPVASDHQWKETLALVIGVAGAIAGIAAFIEARGSAVVVPPLRSPWGEAALVLTVGALVGATVIGLFAYAEVQASSGSGVANGVASAPSQAPVELTAQSSQFAQHSLQLNSGAGTVYVVNRDNTPHTFDIDLAGKHYSYPIPAKSTVAVVMNLSAGRYTYYCAISGHRANGMEGTLSVSAN